MRKPHGIECSWSPLLRASIAEVVSIRMLPMKFLIVLCTLLLPPLAHASSAAMDGNDMLTKCRTLWTDGHQNVTTEEMLDGTFCAGYVSGVLDARAMQFAMDKADHVKGRNKYCRPSEVTNGQVFRVLKKWLDDNPDKLHQRADTIIFVAMQEAFPCQ
jgi:Rap1a immunity proteins